MQSGALRARKRLMKVMHIWPWSQNQSVLVFVPRYGKPLRSQTVDELQILICAAIVGTSRVGSQNVYVAGALAVEIRRIIQHQGPAFEGARNLLGARPDASKLLFDNRRDARQSHSNCQFPTES